MTSAREHMIDLLVADSADTCRQDDGYLLSILRAYWESMDGAQLAYAFRSLSPDDDGALLAGEEGDGREADDGMLESVELRFVPQAWINDQAVTVDGEQPDTWLVPLHYLLEEFPTEEDWIRNGSRRDEMIWSDIVPRWVREWRGPYEIEIAPGETSPWERKRMPNAIEAHAVHIGATIRLKVHVLAPDEAQAAENADDLFSRQGRGVLLIPDAKHVLDTEFAEDVNAYLVDDLDHLRSRITDPGHQPAEDRS